MPRFSPDEELSKVCTDLWHLDKNRLTHGKHYRLNIQEGTHRRSSKDKAADPLFSWVSPEVFCLPTYQTFKVLLDNYERSVGTPEVVTEAERRENWAFLDKICETEVMKHAHEYLVSKEMSPSDLGKFKEQLYDIWFEMYHRSSYSSDLDSSGFEHVFVGETKDRKRLVGGFHNWIQFYLQELAGHIDYHGYILGKKPEEPGFENHLLTIQFKWKNDVKPIGGSFIGTSPEFEMALYTICFLCGFSSHIDLKIADYHVVIVVYKHEDKIATIYPKTA